MDNNMLKKYNNAEQHLLQDLDYNFHIIESSLNNLQQKLTHCPALLQRPESEESLTKIINSLEDQLKVLKEINANESQYISDKKNNTKHENNSVVENINQHTFLEKKLRKIIVNLMVLSLQYWDQHTQKGKLGLAESSKQWTVYISNGRLVARTMERYLNISTVPKYPRIQNVLKTAFFVLKECQLDSTCKKTLEECLRDTQQLVIKIALSKSQEQKNQQQIAC